MTEQVQFTMAARRTLKKIAKFPQNPRRLAFSRAWAKWAKDRPYPELIAALARVELLLDSTIPGAVDSANLIAAFVAEGEKP